MLHECPERVAVGHDQHGPAGHQVGDDPVVPVGEHPGDHVGQALRLRDQLGRQVRVAVVVVRVVLVVGRDRRRRHVVRAAPDLDLVLAVLLCGLGLVAARQVAVVPLIQSPVAAHRHPQAAHAVQRLVGGADGPQLHRGVDHVGVHAGLGHHVACRAGLGAAGVGQVAVVPAGEQVELVPLALAVAEQDELVHGASRVGVVGPGPMLPHPVLVSPASRSVVAGARSSKVVGTVARCAPRS